MTLFTEFGRYLLMIKGMFSKPENWKMYWKELMLQCNEMSTLTAYNIVNSVETEELLDIVDNLMKDSGGTQLQLLNTRIVTKVK